MDEEFPNFFEPPMLPAGNRKIAEAWRRFFVKMSENPEAWTAQWQALQKEHFDAVDAAEPPKNDRRFTSEHWRNNPFFSMLMRTYLTNSEVMRKMVDAVEVSSEDKKLLLFCVNQYIDAAAPTNFPATNPDVMEETANSGGENFVAGMRNMMEDMKLGMVSNHDASAFTVGENLALSKGKVVCQNTVMQLIEYAPTGDRVHARPLLIVPPCINKYYILDLQPKNSFVAHAVAAGHRVFLISWANAGDPQRRLEWDDYLREGVMAAMECTSAVAQSPKINALGFCVGGTLLCAAMAVLAANGERPVQSLTLLASMLDFSDGGEIGMFIDEDHVAALEQKYADGGLMDGRELARGFAALRPNDLIWPYVIQNYYQGKKPPPFDLLFWNADSTNLPGRMFAQYLRQTYLENHFAAQKAGMCGVAADLSNINEPTFVVACEKDHIVPWKSAYDGAKLLGARDMQFVLSEKGHIAGIVNPPSDKKGAYWTPKKSGKKPAGKKFSGRKTAGQNCDEWLQTARRTAGSWWDEWLQWLRPHSGKLIAAPQKQGNTRYTAREDAPGAFVRAPLPAVDEVQP